MLKAVINRYILGSINNDIAGRHGERNNTGKIPDTVFAFIVDTVICMGRVLMENRYVPGEEEIMRKAKEVARVLVAR